MTQTKFEPIHSFGSYFQLYSYKNITEENDFDFATRLIKEYGVAAIPVSSFYKVKANNQVLRFCFTKEEGELKEGAERLSKV